MMQWILLLTLVSSPAFSAPRLSALEEEQKAFEMLERKFNRFRDTAANADNKFTMMRIAVQAGDKVVAEKLADELTALVKTARRQFNDVENWYNDATKIEINFHRQRYSKASRSNPEFGIYLAFRYNDRFGSGSPMDVLMASWRGLKFGEKVEEPPAKRLKTARLDNLPLRRTDSLIVMMTNGGMIRGRFEGVLDDSYIVREVLPNAFGRSNRKGKYRIFNIKDVARLDIIRLPTSIAPQDAPIPTIDPEGNYAGYYVRNDYVARVEFQYSDIELLELVKNGNMEKAKFKPRSRSVDPRIERRPPYTEIFYLDCDLYLRTPST